MDTSQIYQILVTDHQLDKLNFLGVYPIDLIPDTAKEGPCCLVVNTKPHTHKGEHWLALVKTKNNIGIYFDSYGYTYKPYKEIRHFFKNCKIIKQNETKLQSNYTSVCGQYCIFFLTHLAKGYTIEQIVYMLTNTCNDFYYADAFVFNFIKQKYHYILPKSLQVIDNSLIIDQIATSLSL